MSTRHRHPALRNRPTCDDASTGTDASGHECVCIHAPGHPADGSDRSAWHGCVCGAAWCDEATLASDEEAPGARVYQLFARRTTAEEDDGDDRLIRSIEDSVVEITCDELEAAESRAETAEIIRSLLRRMSLVYGPNS